MEDRIRSLLLILGLAALYQPVHAAEAEEQELKPVIQPEVSRREFQESRIDTEDFEITGFIGLSKILEPIRSMVPNLAITSPKNSLSKQRLDNQKQAKRVLRPLYPEHHCFRMRSASSGITMCLLVLTCYLVRSFQPAMSPITLIFICSPVLEIPALPVPIVLP